MENIRTPSLETRYDNIFTLSPLYPLLYLSLLSQKHAPRTQPFSNILPEYDYIVVGSGAGGATVAARLSEISCVSILLLEAGDTPPILTEIPAAGKLFHRSDIDWEFYTLPQKRAAKLQRNRELYFGAGKVIGGTTIMNGMVSLRGSPQIYDQWEAEGAIGWSYKEVLPYFKKMENNKNPESINIPYHGFNGPLSLEKPVFKNEFYKLAIVGGFNELGYSEVDANGPFQKGLHDTQFNVQNGQRCSVAKAYLVPAENRKNLHILKQAFVTKVLIEEKQATGVQFDHDSSSYTVKARREVIISAGAILTPHLLMLSGIGPENILSKYGIHVIEDLPVGLYFQDHIRSTQIYYTDLLPPAYINNNDPHNIEEYIYNKAGPLAFPGRQYRAHLTREENMPFDAVPDYQLSFEFTKYLSLKLDERLNKEIFEEIYGPYKNKSLFLCDSFLMHPKSRGYVSIQSNSPYDPPIIDPNYFDDEDDIEDMIAGLRMCDRLINTDAFKALGVKSFEISFPGCELYDRNSNDYLKCQIESVSLTGHHPVGTAKMGNPLDPSTVVDYELRVKGIYGLRVVDASIMPLIPTGNTMIPTIMIGEKAADIIKKEMICM